jgi:hypothetical protein
MHDDDPPLSGVYPQLTVMALAELAADAILAAGRAT